MKAIAVTVALLALTAAGLFAWKATLPRESWNFAIVDRNQLLTSGTLPPHGDPLQRRNLLRSSLLQALPAALPPEREGDELLMLQIQSLIERRRWTWGWPPLEWYTPVQTMDRVHLYRRVDGWQAGYYPPKSKDVLSSDQAIEHALELMESALQQRIARR